MLRVLILACAALALAAAAPFDEIEGRIVGGDEASAAQFPHQISLRQSGSHICGGSIISRNFILTAAHCVSGWDEEGVFHVTPASRLSIRAGTLDRLIGGVLINVAEVIVHEKYEGFINDVAVLLLETPLIYSQQISPVTLANKETSQGTQVKISGWGRISTDGDIPRMLKYNTVTTMSNLGCQTATLMFSSTLICFSKSSGNGACFGDSGGPAVVGNELVGIAGFVMAGCGSALPDGYAKVYYHRDWIIKHANM